MNIKTLAARLLPVVLTECGAAAPLPDAGYLTAPAALTAAPRTTGCANPIRGYTPRPVIDPSDWRASNPTQRRM